VFRSYSWELQLAASKLGGRKAGLENDGMKITAVENGGFEYVI